MSQFGEMEAVDPIAYFVEDKYTVRRKVLKLFGGAFHVYNGIGEVVLYSKMKAFKLKEDIRLYTDEGMATELLRISARSVIDLGATYDVVDSASGEVIGALRRKAMKSILKDEWVILDEGGHEIGLIKEDSTFKAFARRFVEFVSIFLPQQYHVEMGGRQVAVMKQNFNPFVYKINVDFSVDTEYALDRRLGMAAMILLAAIEGKQG